MAQRSGAAPTSAGRRALAAGAVVRAEGATIAPTRQRFRAGWIHAAELVAGHHHREHPVSRAIAAVAIVLDDPIGTDAARGSVAGARRGRPRERIRTDRLRRRCVVAIGNRSVLVYDIVPDPGRATATAHRRCLVASQEGWHLAGVLGCAARMRRSLASGSSASGLDASCTRSSRARRDGRSSWASSRRSSDTNQAPGGGHRAARKTRARTSRRPRRSHRRRTSREAASRRQEEEVADMPTPGHFVLHSRAVPPLTAGDYMLTRTQQVGRRARRTPYEGHLRVTSPRYRMPPDQILSTFPPANAEGAFEARLPQIVLKRRTLPWERAGDAPSARRPVAGARRHRRRRRAAVGRGADRRVRHAGRDAADRRRTTSASGVYLAVTRDRREQGLPDARRTCRCWRTCARSTSATPSWRSATTTASSPW